MRLREADQSPTLPGKRAALVTAHPSHELRVHHWIELARPLAFVLADGTGYTGQTASMAATDRVLRNAGAEPGPVYGATSEKAVYAAVLGHDHTFFHQLADELATALIRERVDYVAGDAPEGCILIHDVCRLVIDAAVQRVKQRTGRAIGNYDFMLEGPSDGCPAAIRSRAVWLELDEEALRRKAAAAVNFGKEIDFDAAIAPYLGKKDSAPDQIAPAEIRLRLGEAALIKKIEAAQMYLGFSEELNRAFHGQNAQAYRVECLRPVTPWDVGSCWQGVKPTYEQYGEKLVAAGFYQEVIRYRDHVLPLADALRQAASSPGESSVRAA